MTPEQSALNWSASR